MKKLIAMLMLTAALAGAAHAEESHGPLWVSTFKLSCGSKNGIWWEGVNGAEPFIRFYPSREETWDYELKDDKTLVVQGQPCETEPYDCPALGISAPGKEVCGIALPR